jgi:RHH-type proline utilization regulon transcriptional repressor/proline dehydrogenase/delta 1-pyrroline-5-carboxylate dehydrogenase
MSMAFAGFEQRCRDIGQEIFERAEAAEPRPWHVDFWADLMMQWSTSDPHLKTQLFRFIEVLPALTSTPAVARHIKEYLGSTRDQWPPMIQWLLDFRRLSGLRANLLTTIARRAATTMAGRFVSGSNALEAVRTIESLRANNMAFTIDLLGEATNSESAADEHRDIYIDLIESLSPVAQNWKHNPQIDEGPTGPMPKVNVSIKLTALDAHYDPIDPQRSIEQANARLRPVLRAAINHNAFINIDMESYRYKDITFRHFAELMMEPEFRLYPHFGIVVQAYLRSAEQDLQNMLDLADRRGTTFAIRLVKGAYWDHEVVLAVQADTTPPVWTQKWQSDATYEKLAKRMLAANQTIRPAFASHNVRSLAVIMTEAERLGLSHRNFELQMLYGMGGPLKNALASMNQCLRIYSPYGQFVPGMAYLIRRLLENTANDSFLKQSFSDHASRDLLLANPAVIQPPSAPLPTPQYSELDKDIPMLSFHPTTMTNFNCEENRSAMTSAIYNACRHHHKKLPLILNGRQTNTEHNISLRNPADPKDNIAEVSLATPAHADQSVATARNALDLRAQSPTAQRVAIIHKVIDHLKENRTDWAAKLIRSIGKTWREADAEVADAIDHATLYTEQMQRIDANPRRRTLPGQENTISFAPRGVTVAWTSWTSPLSTIFASASAALVTGNPIIIKPATRGAPIAYDVVDLLLKSGAPAGAIQLLFDDGQSDQIGMKLVEHPEVDTIVYFGPQDPGHKVMNAASTVRPGQRRIKQIAAVLDGFNPIIVDDDANLEEAVTGTLASAFRFAGQHPTSCGQVIILDDVYEEFTHRIKENITSLVIGAPSSPATMMGPVIDDSAKQTILQSIKSHLAAGADRIIGENEFQIPDGNYIAPTILNHSNDIDSVNETRPSLVRGPVLWARRAIDFDHAIEMINKDGLAVVAALYSRSPSRIESARTRLDAGTLFINQPMTQSRVDIHPIGFARLGGTGAKYGTAEWLQTFLKPKTISENTVRHGFAPADPQPQTTTAN